MNRDKNMDKQYRYEVKVKSKVCPYLFHIIQINLYCNEKLKSVPKSQIQKKNIEVVDLFCHEKIEDL